MTGYFDNVQYRLEWFVDDIEELIKSNDDDSKDELGDVRGRHFSQSTLEKFTIVIRYLKQTKKCNPPNG